MKFVFVEHSNNILVWSLTIEISSIFMKSLVKSLFVYWCLWEEQIFSSVHIVALVRLKDIIVLFNLQFQILYSFSMTRTVNNTLKKLIDTLSLSMFSKGRSQRDKFEKRFVELMENWSARILNWEHAFWLLTLRLTDRHHH